jgi:hypothetical protein
VYSVGFICVRLLRMLTRSDLEWGVSCGARSDGPLVPSPVFGDCRFEWLLPVLLDSSS